MSYFGGGSGSEANRFVGQLLDLGGGNKLKVKKVIAEGKCVHLHACTHVYRYRYVLFDVFVSFSFKVDLVMYLWLKMYPLAKIMLSRCVCVCLLM